MAARADAAQSACCCATPSAPRIPACIPAWAHLFVRACGGGGMCVGMGGRASAVSRPSGASSSRCSDRTTTSPLFSLYVDTSQLRMRGLDGLRDTLPGPRVAAVGSMGRAGGGEWPRPTPLLTTVDRRLAGTTVCSPRTLSASRCRCTSSPRPGTSPSSAPSPGRPSPRR
jgi:hypothetical protein